MHVAENAVRELSSCDKQHGLLAASVGGAVLDLTVQGTRIAEEAGR
jgi:hypothetical protein